VQRSGVVKRNRCLHSASPPRRVAVVRWSVRQSLLQTPHSSAPAPPHAIFCAPPGSSTPPVVASHYPRRCAFPRRSWPCAAPPHERASPPPTQPWSSSASSGPSSAAMGCEMGDERGSCATRGARDGCQVAQLAKRTKQTFQSNQKVLEALSPLSPFARRNGCALTVSCVTGVEYVLCGS
jgi:hypothetical protein